MANTTCSRSRPATSRARAPTRPAASRCTTTTRASSRNAFILDKANPDLLRIEITTIDHALTRPWTVDKTFRRVREFGWTEYDCAESNNHVQVGKEYYFRSADGYLMPTRKDQPPPDGRYFNVKK